MKKILLLYGGNSNEHEVSCKSIVNIVNNIDEELYKYTIVYITKENIWYIVDNKFEKIKEVKNIISYIKKFDCIFDIIHGRDGEDGRLQSLFEIYNVKYVGCNSASSMLCMDKSLTKLLLEKNNIPFVQYANLNNISFPVMVKPANGGSSIGTNKANNEEELKKSIEEAKKYDSNVIIENYIKGRELECSAIEINNNIYISTVGEIKSANEIYDYDSKYNSSKSKTIIPADLTNDLIIKIKKYALEAFKTLRCKGFARVDFLYDDKIDKIYVNELNTLPGFTDISMFSKLLNFDGITTKQIITILINNSLCN